MLLSRVYLYLQGDSKIISSKRRMRINYASKMLSHYPLILV